MPKVSPRPTATERAASIAESPLSIAPAEGARTDSRRLISPAVAAAVAYVTAIFMTAMDTHIVNVALPTLARSFDAPLADVQWTVLGYVLALALVIPASGWVSDRFGQKRTFQVALATFTIASALCGVAQGLGELVAARALQGLGGGMLLPVGTAMLFRAYPPAQRARVVRLLLVPILLGPATAPILGGWLTTDASWRWVFLINVPIGIVTLLFSAFALVEHREPSGGRLDIIGLILSGVGLSALIYAIGEGAVRGWTSPPIVIAGTGGVIALAIFVRSQLRRTEPLLDLRLLENRLFRSCNIVFCLGSGAFMGTLYLTPIFLQDALHVSPIQSGLTTFVEALGVAVASQTLGRLYPRLGPRVMATAGSLMLTAVLLSFVWVGTTTNLWWIRIAMFALGAFNSAIFLAMQSSMFTTISSADTGQASAIYNTLRQTSIVTSIAILTTTVTAFGGSQLSSFHAAYVAAAAMAAGAGVTAFTLVRTSDARGSMAPRVRPVQPSGAPAAGARVPSGAARSGGG